MSVPTPASLFVISAPSGAGKTSLVRALLDSVPGLALSLSCTTRLQRPGEQDGVDYHFLERARFREMVAADEFLEYAEVFGNYYGTCARHVEASLAAGDDVILEIDWQGAQQIRALRPDCVCIFILPPSRQELERRLRGRKQDSEAVIARRLSEAVDDMRHYDEFDYVVVNDDFDTALAELQAVVTAARLSVARQRARRAAMLAELLA